MSCMARHIPERRTAEGLVPLVYGYNYKRMTAETLLIVIFMNPKARFRVMHLTDFYYTPTDAGSPAGFTSPSRVTRRMAQEYRFSSQVWVKG